jgi:hypothetical protein
MRQTGGILMGQNKLLIGTIATAGIVLLLVIGYRMGQRQTQAPVPAGAPMMQAAPGSGAGTGPGHRKQQMAQNGQGQGRNRKSSDEATSGNGGNSGRNSGGAVQVQEGTLGSEKIAVIAAGKESGFTGKDLEGLEPTTVATMHGARKGWAVVEVMKHLGITDAKELVLVNKDGKTLSLPWEKLTGQGAAIILTYNRMGGLMLLSGVQMTEEQLQTGQNRDVRASAQQEEDRLFLSGIIKIEVKT